MDNKNIYKLTLWNNIPIVSIPSKTLYKYVYFKVTFMTTAVVEIHYLVEWKPISAHVAIS